MVEWWLNDFASEMIVTALQSSLRSFGLKTLLAWKDFLQFASWDSDADLDCSITFLLCWHKNYKHKNIGLNCLLIPVYTYITFKWQTVVYSTYLIVLFAYTCAKKYNHISMAVMEWYQIDTILCSFPDTQQLSVRYGWIIDKVDLACCNNSSVVFSKVDETTFFYPPFLLA